MRRTQRQPHRRRQQHRGNGERDQHAIAVGLHQRFGGRLQIEQLDARCVHRARDRRRIAQAGHRYQRGGVTVAVHQQTADARGQRRAVEIAHGQRRRSARALDIDDEVLERIAAERGRGDGRIQRGAQGVWQRQPRLPRALGGGAGQHARRAVVAGHGIALDQRIQRRMQRLDPLQRVFDRRAADRQQITHVGRAERLAQVRVLGERVRRHRGEFRQIVLPERAGRERHHGNGQRGQRRELPGARTRHARDGFPHARQARRRSGVARCGVDQARQQETRGQCGHAQTRDGEHRKLLQPVHAGKQKRDISDAGRRDAGRQRGPDRARVRPWGNTGALMAEQVDRIILHHADQRETEGDGDAVHAFEQQRHRAQPRQPRAGERQHAEQRRAPAAVSDQQQQNQADAVDHADPRRFALSSAADLDRKRARAGEGHDRPAVAARIGKGGVDRAHRQLLSGGVEARGFGFDRQQRLASGPVEPHPVQALRRIGRLHRFGDAQRFEGGVGGQQRFDQPGGGRAEILHARLQRVA